MVLQVEKEIGVQLTSATFTLHPGDWMIVDDKYRIKQIWYHINSELEVFKKYNGLKSLDVKEEWASRSGLVQVGTNWAPIKARIGHELIDVTQQHNRDQILDQLINI